MESRRQSQYQTAVLETPSNPLGEVANLEALAELAHGIGAILVVDNSLLSPSALSAEARRECFRFFRNQSHRRTRTRDGRRVGGFGRTDGASRRLPLF